MIKMNITEFLKDPFNAKGVDEKIIKLAKSSLIKWTTPGRILNRPCSFCIDAFKRSVSYNKSYFKICDVCLCPTDLCNEKGGKFPELGIVQQILRGARRIGNAWKLGGVIRDIDDMYTEPITMRLSDLIKSPFEYYFIYNWRNVLNE